MVSLSASEIHATDVIIYKVTGGSTTLMEYNDIQHDDLDGLQIAMCGASSEAPERRPIPVIQQLLGGAVNVVVAEPELSHALVARRQKLPKLYGRAVARVMAVGGKVEAGSPLAKLELKQAVTAMAGSIKDVTGDSWRALNLEDDVLRHAIRARTPGAKVPIVGAAGRYTTVTGLAGILEPGAALE